MDARFWKAAIAGGVTLFILGFVFYGWLLMDYFAANTAEGLAKDPPGFVLIFVGDLVYAVFLTMVLGWRGVSNVGEGFKAALMVGLLVVLATNLVLFGAFDMMNGSAVVVDVVIQTVRVAVAGAVIGMLLGGPSPEPPMV